MEVLRKINHYRNRPQQPGYRSAGLRQAFDDIRSEQAGHQVNLQPARPWRLRLRPAAKPEPLTVFMRWLLLVLFMLGCAICLVLACLLPLRALFYW